MNAAAAPHPDDVRFLVEEVLRTGLMLADLFEHLHEMLPDDAYPGEDKGEVIIEMIAGSSFRAAAALGREALTNATAMVGAVGDRTLEDLRVALGRNP